MTCVLHRPGVTTQLVPFENAGWPELGLLLDDGTAMGFDVDGDGTIKSRATG